MVSGALDGIIDGVRSMCSFTEANLMTFKHVLVCLDVEPANAAQAQELEYLVNNFYGKVCDTMDAFNAINTRIGGHLAPDSVIYLCGNLELFQPKLGGDNAVLTIVELSRNFSEGDRLVSLGAVPINIYDAGVYLRDAFDEDDYFGLICAEHEFQNLGEPNTELQKSIYLTSVKDTERGTEFNLLRCSTNLHGPTFNFKETDKKIIERVNAAANQFFTNPAELNHVLAQIYVNQRPQSNKERKSNEHSDKTKDMPGNGVIAFCSFYKDYRDGAFRGASSHMKRAASTWTTKAASARTTKAKKSTFDYTYKNISLLTVLRFRLKSDVPDDTTLQKCFDITLYPNSLFMIPLKTNRLYTHEIIPSTLSVDKLPVRMDYVVRCSNTSAVHRNNQTYIIEGDREVKLREMTNTDIEAQRRLHWIENSTSQTPKYPPTYFSMNRGDYQRPHT